MKTRKSSPAKPSEATLIRKLMKAAFPGNRVKLGIGDDAALLSSRPSYDTVLTCDWFLEGTHFLRDKHPPDAVGWKSLARAVSDIAAMGGQPRCFLLSLALPETHAGRWLDEFQDGIARAARRLRCPLAGGDTTRRRDICINITVVGEVRSGLALLRSGTHPGDIIYVSGRLGEAELGLRQICRATNALELKRYDRHVNRGEHSAVRKHLYPEPRLAVGHWLATHRLASAMMDLSDGLSSDLPRLCGASRVGARIEATKIPAVTALSSKEAADALNLALNGGDDYELLFTVRPTKTSQIPRSYRGVPLTPIGVVTRDPGVTLVRPDGRAEPLTAAGWDPFRS